MLDGQKLAAEGSGIDVSWADLRDRGAGDLFGTAQSGDFQVGAEMQMDIYEKALVAMRKEFVLSGESNGCRVMNTITTTPQHHYHQHQKII